MNLPRHVAVVMDGNRRWARQRGFANPSVGHRYGAEHVEDLLGWCAELGIDHVTVYVCSRDNLLKRDTDEVGHLMRMVEEVIVGRRRQDWQMHVAGRLDILPASTRDALLRAVSDNEATDRHLTVAIGYDGRDEIVDAVRSYLKHEAAQGVSASDLATRVSAEDIARHLYTATRPDPDLIIRTSGERRLSGFLIWQAAHSELHFSDAYWPGFSKEHFLNAVNTYAKRQRPTSTSPNRIAAP